MQSIFRKQETGNRKQEKLVPSSLFLVPIASGGSA